MVPNRDSQFPDAADAAACDGSAGLKYDGRLGHSLRPGIRRAGCGHRMVTRSGPRFRRDPRCLLGLAAALLSIATQTVANASAEDPPPSPPRLPASLLKNLNANDNAAPVGVVVAEGQLVNSIGAGVVGARIEMRRRAAEGLEGELIGSVESDAMGDFAIRAPAAVTGEFRLTITKDGSAPITHEFAIAKGDVLPFFGDTMQGNCRLAGRVVAAPGGTPLPGASVQFRNMFLSRDAKTDERGEFELTSLPGDGGQVTATAAGFGRQSVTVAPLPAAEPLVIELLPERTVTIRVANDRGEPVPQAVVEILDEPRSDFRTEVTREDGSLTVRGLHFHARTLLCRVTHRDLISSGAFDRTLELPEDSAESSQELVIPRAGRIEGVVRAAATGEPIHGARVVTGAGVNDDSPRAFTTVDGTFTITGVAGGDCVLTVHRTGFSPELQIATVVPGETARIALTLTTSKPVSGVVKDAGGKPVRGAMVSATGWRGEFTLGLRAMTDDEGRFQIDDPPADRFEVRILARGMQPLDAAVEPLAPNEFTLEGSVEAEPRVAVKEGDAAPELSFTLLSGRPVAIKDLRGKVVLLDFWATWCGPCVAEVPTLGEVHKRFGSRKDFEMYGVSLDADERALRTFIETRKLGWEHAFGQSARDAADAFGVDGIPHVFLIGPDGKIVASDLRGDELIRRVEEALKAPVGP